jgi:hypothetical protein
MNNLLKQLQNPPFETELLKADLFMGQDKICTGHGRMKADTEGRIQLMVFTADAANLDRELRLLFGTPPGQLIDEDSLYSLHGRVMGGQSLIVRHLVDSGGERNAKGDSSYIFTAGPSARIVFVDNDPLYQPGCAHAILSGTSDFPWSLRSKTKSSTVLGESESKPMDGFGCVGGGYDFKLQKTRDDLCELAVLGEIRQMSKAIRAFCFAATFVSGKNVRPIGIVIGRRTEIKSIVTPERTYQYAPIAPKRAHPEEFRKLIEKTVDSLVNGKNNLRRAFEYSVSLCHYSSRVDIVSKVMILCAVAEFLAGVLENVNDKFKTQCIDENNFSALIRLVQDHQHEYPSIDVDRIHGKLGSMKTPGPSNILSVAKNVFPISDDEINAWEYVRNRVMHGEFEKWPKGDYTLQAKLDSTAKIATLINKILFYLIGYEGQYTDYGQRDYPLKTFKLCSLSNDADHTVYPSV